MNDIPPVFPYYLSYIIFFRNLSGLYSCFYYFSASDILPNASLLVSSKFAIDATECLNPCNVICGSSLVIMHLLHPFYSARCNNIKFVYQTFIMTKVLEMSAKMLAKDIF